MHIDDFNIDELVNKKYFHKKINDNFYLSDEEINILKRNGINYENYSSLKELLFDLEEILLEEENEELDFLANELEEFYYYNYVNK